MHEKNASLLKRLFEDRHDVFLFVSLVNFHRSVIVGTYQKLYEYIKSMGLKDLKIA